jgi:hypothetical protein
MRDVALIFVLERHWKRLERTLDPDKLGLAA